MHIYFNSKALFIHGWNITYNKAKGRTNGQMNKYTSGRQTNKALDRQCTAMVNTEAGSSGQVIEVQRRPLKKQMSMWMPTSMHAHMFSVQGHSLFRTSSNNHINNYPHLYSSIRNLTKGSKIRLSSSAGKWTEQKTFQSTTAPSSRSIVTNLSLFGNSCKRKAQRWRLMLMKRNRKRRVMVRITDRTKFTTTLCLHSWTVLATNMPL